jgi:HEAT repeat protein
MLKRTLRVLLEEERYGRIAELAGESNRVLGLLTSLTFDADPLVAWRAVRALGLAAARIADDRPAVVREHLRRLHWLLSEESGGICWRAPEAMAEIVHRRPMLFADWVPIIAHLILETAEEDLAHFRPGMLWAVGRLGPLTAGDADVEPVVVAALDHPDPQVRGVAVWTLAQLGRTEVLARRPELRSDEGGVTFFEEGILRHTTVARVLEGALGGEPGD